MGPGRELYTSQQNPGNAGAFVNNVLGRRSKKLVTIKTLNSLIFYSLSSKNII